MARRIIVRSEGIKDQLWITKIELEIMQAIARGDTSKEIAERRGMSFKTVEVHRHQLLKRLKCKNMPQLVAFLYEEKILGKKSDRHENHLRANL